MKRRILSFVKYFIYWVILFAIMKPFFMLYHWNISGDFEPIQWLKVIYYGKVLDFSMAGYISVIPGLLLILSCWIKPTWIKRVFVGYHAITLFIAMVIYTVDLELYSYWGFHLDNTVFFYLETPKDAAASMTTSLIFFEVTLFLLMFVCFLYLFVHLFKRDFTNYPKVGVATPIVLFLCTISLFYPIRGGFNVSTMNIGKAYFSDKMYLNHCAINPTFFFMQSFFRQKIDVSRYSYMENEEAEATRKQLILQTENVNTDTLLKTNRPNILFIILESFSSTVVAPLGGLPDVAPNLNRYCEEGILFTNVYASSFRTDRGLVSILSGYPGQPTTSIMRYPAKTQTLPFFSKDLQEAGYDLKFYYGGDEDFTNMRSYLIAGGYKNRISDKDFPLKDKLSKWGAHDHLVFDKLKADLNQETHQPFLKTMLTQSSHEPFKVPGSKKFDDPYLNSIAYSDSCLGDFLDTFKKSPLWDNTLIILTPDHGMKYPKTMLNHIPERYDIPVVWLGGAIKGPKRIETMASQIDIAPTLLAQLGMNTDSYSFAKNILGKGVKPFAFYSFIDGFGFMTPESKVVYDCQAKKVILSEGSSPETNLTDGKAFLQSLYLDLESRH